MPNTNNDTKKITINNFNICTFAEEINKELAGSGSSYCYKFEWKDGEIVSKRYTYQRDKRGKNTLRMLLSEIATEDITVFEDYILSDYKKYLGEKHHSYTYFS